MIRFVVSFMLVAIVVSGCGRSTEQQSSESSASSPAKPAPPKIMVGPREISGYVFEGFDQALAQRDDGRVGDFPLRRSA